jgi:hypothetical protein
MTKDIRKGYIRKEMYEDLLWDNLYFYERGDGSDADRNHRERTRCEKEKENTR